MSKKDNKKIKQKRELQRLQNKENNQLENTTQTPKKRKRNKSNTQKKEKFKNLKIGGLTLLIMILIFLVVAYFYGKYVLKTRGYETSKDAVSSFITAFSKSDLTGMSHAFSLDSKTGYTKAQEYYETMHKSDKDIEMFLDDMYIKVTPDEEYYKTKVNATASENVYVEVPAQYKTDQYIFYVVMKYNMKTVKERNKWFIDDITEDEAVIVNCIVNPDIIPEATVTDSTESTE